MNQIVKTRSTKSQIILYQTEDGQTKIETRLEDETVWLTLQLIANLFGVSKSTISEHISNIYRSNELKENSTVRKFRTVQNEGGRNVSRELDYYNLDIIISVGYRVNSTQATRFRIWATQILKEYIIKGFTMNDDLLKEAGGGVYFDELLERIRDIRSSEKVFWRKVLDIYATSIDYDPDSDLSTKFFKTVQNKMHWAAHGNTAAEIIYKRINSRKSNLGLTSFKGNRPTSKEIEIAKNYLSREELDILNRMVTAYLEVAEIKALEHTPMHMKDWIEQLNSFLTMTGKKILDHAGEISHEAAIEKAHGEYNKYKNQFKDELTRAEKDFIKHIDTTAKILGEKSKKR